LPSRVFLTLAIVFLPVTGWSQQDTAPLSPKALYYQGWQDDSAPAKAVQPKKATPSKPAPVAANQADVQAPNKSAVSAVITPVVQHLGLRYNLVLVDRGSRKSMAVDRDRLFHPGECVQLEFSPNHSGYLYVFLKSSSGKWQPLFPSNLMSDEVNVVRAREAVKIPSNYCFQIDPPAGTEHLFVVLSRNQEDINSLDRAVRGKTKSQVAPVAPQNDTTATGMVAENRLDAEVQRMRAELGSRDMSIQKIGEPDRPGEPEDSVYIVNAANVTSDRLVSEILIRHD
jgi:Domain of unknown function (DUF4384)